MSRGCMGEMGIKLFFLDKHWDVAIIRNFWVEKQCQ